MVGEGEGATLPRLVGGKPPLVLSQPQAITFTLLFEPVERVLEAGDGTERRDSDGEIDLVIGAGALKQGLLVVIVTTPEALALINEIEAADRCDVDFTLALELDEGEDFLHQRPAGILALRVRLAHHGDCEGIA